MHATFVVRIMLPLFAVSALLSIGVVPAIADTYQVTSMASFDGTNGATPNGPLLLVGGALYGTALYGGVPNLGTVYSIPLSGGPLTVLATFDGTNGAKPMAGLTVSNDGNTLYGATYVGGGSNSGTVFSIPTTGGSVTTLYTFTGGSDGANPTSALTLSNDGSTLYGVTHNGGTGGEGTVFSVPTAGGSINVLATFTSGNGACPQGSLILSGGTLYGTTQLGGAPNDGTVFSIPTTGGAITTLATFNGGNGATPSGALVLSGNTLYGTTSNGGGSSSGTVFSVPATGGVVTTLVTFNSTNGMDPSSSLVLLGNVLFGTAYEGGANGKGTAFSVSTSGGPIRTLYAFTGGSDGENPVSALTLSGATLYGTASYGGSNYDGSVFKLSPLTTTRADASPNASIYSAPVTIVATVIPHVPDGETVTFLDGLSPLGTGTTAGSVASLTTSTLALGLHSITAGYPGDTDYVGSTSSAFVQSVLIGRPTTVLTSSANLSAYGTSVTFTATLSLNVPNGETVAFYDGPASKKLIGTGTTFGGVATLTTSGLLGGNHSIWANYVGDGNFAYSWSSALTQTVTPTTTTTNLASSLNPSTYGALITLVASLSTGVPNGEIVIFLDGASTIGTARSFNGTATLRLSTLALGSHSITVNYPGDSNYGASVSSPLSQTVNQIPTTTGIKSLPNPTSYGSSVTFTAWLRPIVPDGETVSFSDGAVSIGSGTTSGGLATVTTSTLLPGSHNITASYIGDTNYSSSSSSTLTHVVFIVRPVTTLVSALNPCQVGTELTFTATISPAVPDGETVNFYDGPSSKRLIGTVTTLGGVATFITSALTVGSHMIWADYVGDANNAYSWSNGLTQTLN